MIIAWQELGLKIQWNRNEAVLYIEGCGGNLKNQAADLFVANSGTHGAISHGGVGCLPRQIQLGRSASDEERPIQDLLVGLQALGANVYGLMKRIRTATRVCGSEWT